MGREIRRVPPNWQHPKDANGHYKHLHDQDYDTAAREWLDGLANFTPQRDCKYYWDWDGGPPDSEYYRPDFGDTATWYQVYETVSEGTPVSPPFETQEELVDYLAKYGDFWGQKRGYQPPSIEQAQAFVSSGWAPSFVVRKTETDTVVLDSYESSEMD